MLAWRPRPAGLVAPGFVDQLLFLLLRLVAVPRAGMINESGIDGACYYDKGVF
jgi:hypothetical protein